jgi:hypothetical protein
MVHSQLALSFVTLMNIFEVHNIISLILLKMSLMET